MASNYFSTDQVLELVLADGSDLEDEESVEDFGDLESESDLENCAVLWKIVYSPLAEPMAKETQSKVSRLITNMHGEKHIDDMTKKWLSQTPCPPRIPEFYTLTKIHKPTLTGRPIISGCDGPTEKNIIFC